MGRPRKNPDDPKWLSATERVTAPVTEPVHDMPPVIPPPPPRQKRIERQGARTEPYTRRYPQVRGGICEFCGVIDPNVPSQYQYRLCPHFRNIGALRCSYCADNKDPDEVIYHANLNVAESPNNPDELIVWCDSYECSRAHEARFRRSH